MTPTLTHHEDIAVLTLGSDENRFSPDRLDAINDADPESETAQSLAQSFGDRAAQSVAQDLFRALASEIQSRAGVSIDQQALNAVHANFQ